MTDADIPTQASPSKGVALVPSAFELWAHANGYDTVTAVLPVPHRIYAARQTLAAYDAWKAGSANTVRVLTESTLESDALRGRIKNSPGET